MPTIPTATLGAKPPLRRHGGRSWRPGPPGRGRPPARDMIERHGASVSARVVARLLELASVLPAMEAGSEAMVPGEAFCAHASLPDECQGRRPGRNRPRQPGPLAERAPGPHRPLPDHRPTTWNFSPRDAADRPGPLEQALVGLPAGPNAPPTVQRRTLLRSVHGVYCPLTGKRPIGKGFRTVYKCSPNVDQIRAEIRPF